MEHLAGIGALVLVPVDILYKPRPQDRFRLLAELCPAGLFTRRLR